MAAGGASVSGVGDLSRLGFLPDGRSGKGGSSFARGIREVALWDGLAAPAKACEEDGGKLGGEVRSEGNANVAQW